MRDWWLRLLQRIAVNESWREAMKGRTVLEQLRRIEHQRSGEGVWVEDNESDTEGPVRHAIH